MTQVRSRDKGKSGLVLHGAGGREDELRNGGGMAFWWGMRRRVNSSDGWWVERESREVELLKNVWELLVWAKSTPVC